MRNMLAFVAALVLALAGVGLYLDWFHIRTGTPGSGRRTVNIDINTDKIGEDLREGGEYIIEQGGEKIHEIVDKHRKDESTPPTPRK
jgi:hypothetical protein